MSKIIIGIDPDSKAHGIAIYYDGKLGYLKSMTLFELYDHIEQDIQHFGDAEIHIEDVCAISNSCFHWKPRDSKYVKAKKSEHIGLCKQAQIELERMAKVIDVKVVKHKISKQWKDAKSGKKMFQRITGWTKQSNEDTRSAAYFGWLGCKK